MTSRFLVWVKLLISLRLVQNTVCNVLCEPILCVVPVDTLHRQRRTAEVRTSPTQLPCNAMRGLAGCCSNDYNDSIDMRELKDG